MTIYKFLSSLRSVLFLNVMVTYIKKITISVYGFKDTIFVHKYLGKTTTE